MPEDKRTQIGTAGPARPATAQGPAAAVVVATTRPGGTPAPTTDPPGAHSYLPPATDPMLGQVLAGRYLIQRKLGEGGMGAVYLATHNVLEKQVALKLLHGEFARKPDLVERFMQEAKAASRIRHENVIDISDFGHTPEGLVFFAMELLKGHDLHEEIARARLAGQLLPWERSKRIFLQICSALTAAHALGIIHRDLKPENIYLVEFLGEPDFVKLLDFGIAKLTEAADGDRKLTRTGMLFGTPEYMSPEQARGETPDHRVDVYAMGCILFQLVTGRVPFEAENFMGVLSMHLVQPPPVIPPEVFDSIGAPRALAQVIDQALAKDRNQRYATIDDLARAVRRASGDKPTGPVATQANVAAPPSTATMGRVKTQWTGNLSVPEVDPEVAARPAKSRLPVILGAVALAGGAAALAAVLASGGSKGGGAGSAAGSAGQAAAGGAGGAGAAGAAGASVPTVPASAPGMPASAPGMPTPPASPTTPAVPAQTEAPLTFGRTQIRLDSTPSQAEVRDPTSGKVIGHTPFSFTLPASHVARQFGLHRTGYVDVLVEIVPDQPEIKHKETLERGSATAAPVVHHATGPAHPVAGARPDGAAADAPVIKPDPTHEPEGKPEATKPDVKPEATKPDVKPEATKPDVKPEVKPEAKPEATKPEGKPAQPPRPDDEIMLKPDPSRTGSGSASP